MEVKKLQNPVRSATVEGSCRRTQFVLELVLSLYETSLPSMSDELTILSVETYVHFLAVKASIESELFGGSLNYAMEGFRG